MTTSATETRQRVLCLSCLRPTKSCYCDRVRAFEHPLRFAILQHPREARNAMGTARMAHLCLANSQLIRGVSFTRCPRFRAIVDDPTQQAMVLYPGPRAQVVGQDTRTMLRATFERRPTTIFVVDGTWPQAKSMIRKTPELQRLPWIAFESDRVSGYKIRTEPDPRCLATIEAIHELIDALARWDIVHPDRSDAHQNLVDVFEHLNETQLAYVRDPNQPGYRRGTGREGRSSVPAKRWEVRRLFFDPEVSNGTSAAREASRVDDPGQ